MHKNKFLLDEKITTIIGENGTGKTNIFHALRFLLESNNRMFINEDTFSSLLGNPKGHWIIISATFQDVGDRVEEIHLKPMEDKSAIYTFLFRPIKQVRIKMHSLSNEVMQAENELLKSQKIAELRQYINRIDIRSDYEIKRTVTTIFNFLSDDEYSRVVGDFNELVFPDPEIQDDKRIIGNDDIDFLKFANITFIPAIRDVNSELTNSNNFLSRMLKNVSENVEPSQWQKFEEHIIDINKDLSDIKEFNDFIDDVDKLTRETVGDIYTSNVQLNMEIPSKRANLMRYFSLKGKEEDAVYDLYNRSLGDNNIVYFALKLAESRMNFGHSNKVYNLLLIEEPEAHIHKFLQETLFKGIRNQQGDYQLIISTHSVHISESSKISSMLVLEKNGKSVKSFSPTSGLTQEEIESLERYFSATKAPVLFAKTVWLVEGAAELLLIPTLYRLLYDIELSALGISLISVDGSYFDYISSLFHEERIQKYSAILTDGDKDFINPGSEKEQNAQSRNNCLVAQQTDNKYVFVSISDYTFEIDFFRENIKDFKRFLKSHDIYRKESTIEELSCSDEKVVFNRIMKIADTLGKGKLSFMYTKWLEQNKENVNIKIPSYIENAFQFLYKKIVTQEKFNEWKNKQELLNMF